MDHKAGRDLALFLAGIAMCAGGIYLFLSNVDVETRLWGTGSGVSYWGLFKGNGIPSGMITIPLIIGIVMLFFAPKSFWSKLVTVLGMLVILLGVISSTSFRFRSTSAFNYVLMVVLIFGGFAMVMRILLMGGYSERNSEETKKYGKNKDSAPRQNKNSKSVDEMLEEMKKD